MDSLDDSQSNNSNKISSLPPSVIKESSESELSSFKGFSAESLLDIPLKIYEPLNCGDTGMFKLNIDKYTTEDLVVTMKGLSDEVKFLHGRDSFYKSLTEACENMPDSVIVCKNIKLNQADEGWWFDLCSMFLMH